VAGGKSGAPSTAASEQLICIIFFLEHVAGGTSGTPTTTASEQLMFIIFL
jgi:hypothetical protein